MTGCSDKSPAGAFLTVDLGALVANWRLLRDRAAPAACAAVVKADAYGCGIEAVVSALAQAGCATFFVAQIAEGIRARTAAGAEASIYVLNGLLPGAAPAFAANALRPVLGSRPEIEEWAPLCRGAEPRPAAIHVDTGMNRLGLPPDEARALAKDPVLATFKPVLLMSHFVAAEDPTDPITARQVAEFGAIAALFPAVPASLANSSGLFLAKPLAQALARPGYALYGGNPVPGRPNPMRPVVGLDAQIVQVRAVEAGARVGYNGRWTAERPSLLATLSVGYADGIPRGASGRGAALVGGALCPFLGTVSMDLIVIDVTEAPADSVERGAPATLIGEALDIDEVARRAGTIGYEILTRLGPRYRRRYVGG